MHTVRIPESIIAAECAKAGLRVPAIAVLNGVLAPVGRHKKIFETRTRWRQYAAKVFRGVPSQKIFYGRVQNRKKNAQPHVMPTLNVRHMKYAIMVNLEQDVEVVI